MIVKIEKLISVMIRKADSTHAVNELAVRLGRDRRVGLPHRPQFIGRDEPPRGTA